MTFIWKFVVFQGLVGYCITDVDINIGKKVKLNENSQFFANLKNQKDQSQKKNSEADRLIGLLDKMNTVKGKYELMINQLDNLINDKIKQEIDNIKNEGHDSNGTNILRKEAKDEVVDKQNQGDYHDDLTDFKFNDKNLKTTKDEDKDKEASLIDLSLKASENAISDLEKKGYKVAQKATNGHKVEFNNSSLKMLLQTSAHAVSNDSNKFSVLNFLGSSDSPKVKPADNSDIVNEDKHNKADGKKDTAKKANKIKTDLKKKDIADKKHLTKKLKPGSSTTETTTFSTSVDDNNNLTKTRTTKSTEKSKTGEKITIKTTASVQNSSTGTDTKTKINEWKFVDKDGIIKSDDVSKQSIKTDKNGKTSETDEESSDHGVNQTYKVTKISKKGKVNTKEVIINSKIKRMLVTNKKNGKKINEIELDQKIHKNGIVDNKKFIKRKFDKKGEQSQEVIEKENPEGDLIEKKLIKGNRVEIVKEQFDMNKNVMKKVKESKDKNCQKNKKVTVKYYDVKNIGDKVESKLEKKAEVEVKEKTKDKKVKIPVVNKEKGLMGKEIQKSDNKEVNKSNGVQVKKPVSKQNSQVKVEPKQISENNHKVKYKGNEVKGDLVKVEIKGEDMPKSSEKEVEKKIVEEKVKPVGTEKKSDANQNGLIGEDVIPVKGQVKTEVKPVIRTKIQKVASPAGKTVEEPTKQEKVESSTKIIERKPKEEKPESSPKIMGKKPVQSSKKTSNKAMSQNQDPKSNQILSDIAKTESPKLTNSNKQIPQNQAQKSTPVISAIPPTNSSTKLQAKATNPSLNESPSRSHPIKILSQPVTPSM